METKTTRTAPAYHESQGWAYCPLCTHTVETVVLFSGRRSLVKPGQKCPRCGAALEAASVLRFKVAA